ncbi:MAG: hypothetical protein J7L08_00610 [Candidatus Aenigmarchaeota archaeon]|nr:hypothetical protein [Candidatus Aenigmarchaeota archaeon]
MKTTAEENPYTLNDDLFWKWLDFINLNGPGISDYIKIINNPSWIKADSIVSELIRNNKTPNNSSMMNNLSECVPRKYFLELQYCASIYAAIFGKIFPPYILHVEQLVYIEWLLYTEARNSRYRDHLAHMFKVAFCGDRILSCSESFFEEVVNYQFSSKHFTKWCTDQSIAIELWGYKEKEIIVKIALFLSAIFHDFGYGYYFLNEYKKKLFKIYPWLLPRADIADPNTTATQTLLKSLPAYFVKENHKGLSENCLINSDNMVAGFFHDCLPLNHSIASAFFVLDLAENLQKSGAISQDLYVAFQLAAEACMIHDMTDKENKKWVHLSATKETEHFINHHNQKQIPLAMLLIFSDELSVWNRPRLIHKAPNNGAVITKLEDDDNLIKSLLIEIYKEKKEISTLVDAPKEVKKKFIDDFQKIRCLQSSTNNDQEILGYKLIFS